MGGKATASPSDIANAQTGSNIQTAQAQSAMNAPLGNVANSWGSNAVLTNGLGLPIGQISQLSQPLQNIFNQQTGNAQTLGSNIGSLASNLPQSFNVDFGNSVNNAANSAYGAQTGFLMPQFQLQQKQLDQQLTDRGLPIGSEAWGDAESNLHNGQNLALTQAANNAYGAGLQAENQGFNQGVTQANLPYSWLTSLSSINPSAQLLAQAPGAANLSPSAIQPTNVNQAYQTSIQAQQAQNAQLAAGLLGVGKLGLALA